MKLKTKILDSTDVIKLLSYADVMKVVEKAYAEIAEGKIINPPKTSVVLSHDPEEINWINSMPAYLVDDKIVGVKWVNVTSKNKRKKLPITMGVIFINDAITGRLLCIMDGSWLTYTRTGASVALGVKYLAKKNFKRIALIGAGDNAKTTIVMLATLYDFLEINIASRSGKNVAKLVKKYESDKIRFHVCDSIEAAVKDAEVIILSTTANETLVKESWGKKGDLICTISGLRDLDPKFVGTADHIVFDSKKSGLKRVEALTGVKINPDKSKMDLCEMAAQKKTLRTSDDEMIIYMPVGLAGTDVLLALEAFKKSNAKKVGKIVSLFDTKHIDFPMKRKK